MVSKRITSVMAVTLWLGALALPGILASRAARIRSGSFIMSPRIEGAICQSRRRGRLFDHAHPFLGKNDRYGSEIVGEPLDS